jgi:4-carboxymuconolactone decarboxylase
MATRTWHYPEVVPKLSQLGAQVLYGDVWERDELSKRDRSLITVAALIALYRPEQLEAHMERALDNDVTAAELSEVVTHMAFYAGWPSAVTAGEILRSVLQPKS